jgi:asparagine synthase (glutamine-hydrolysing)
VFRYIIVAGNPQSSSDFDAVSVIRRRMQGFALWRTALAQPGIYAAYVEPGFASDAPVMLHDNRGVIFGSLFRSPTSPDSAPPKSICCVNRNASENILKSKGRSLVSDFWGYYVAALNYPESHSAVVVRAPVSPLACFQVRLGNLNAFFSHVDDWHALDLTQFSINWDSITAQVVGADYLTAETAINEVTSLECGESLDCGPSGCSKTVYWDPRSFLADRTLANFSHAVAAVRNTTEYCVNALSSTHDRILVNLSGGLDSSIVLSSLSRSPHRPTITSVNYFSRGCGDERRFANSMANRVNCALVERPRNNLLDFRRFLDCNRTARPVLNFSAPDVEARNIALAKELNASAIFNGELGDNIFGSHPSAGALVECIRQSGLGPGFLSVALDYAMLTKHSIWQTLALTRREYQRVFNDPDFSSAFEMEDGHEANISRAATLASSDAQDCYHSMGGRFMHPWLKRSRCIAPGSHMMLFGLIAATSTPYHSPFSHSDDPPEISPLVSQPLVEIALRIPAYFHCKSAQDRAVARTAFADVLPQEVLGRGLGKGGPDLWAKDVVENNLGFLRDFLLGGTLVQRRLIDRAQVETVLSPRVTKSTVMVGDILATLYIEAWLRQW